VHFHAGRGSQRLPSKSKLLARKCAVQSLLRFNDGSIDGSISGNASLPIGNGGKGARGLSDHKASSVSEVPRGKKKVQILPVSSKSKRKEKVTHSFSFLNFPSSELTGVGSL